MPYPLSRRYSVESAADGGVPHAAAPSLTNSFAHAAAFGRQAAKLPELSIIFDTTLLPKSPDCETNASIVLKERNLSSEVSHWRF
jgi:hypothetical protein